METPAASDDATATTDDTPAWPSRRCYSHPTGFYYQWSYKTAFSTRGPPQIRWVNVIAASRDSLEKHGRTR